MPFGYLIFSPFYFITHLFILQEANKPPDSWFELKVNTHVYVTGLPDDVTFDEAGFTSYFLTSVHLLQLLCMTWQEYLQI